MPGCRDWAIPKEHGASPAPARFVDAMWSWLTRARHGPGDVAGVGAVITSDVAAAGVVLLIAASLIARLSRDSSVGMRRLAGANYEGGVTIVDN